MAHRPAVLWIRTQLDFPELSFCDYRIFFHTGLSEFVEHHDRRSKTGFIIANQHHFRIVALPNQGGDPRRQFIPFDFLVIPVKPAVAGSLNPYEFRWIWWARTRKFEWHSLNPSECQGKLNKRSEEDEANINQRNDLNAGIPAAPEAKGGCFHTYIHVRAGRFLARMHHKFSH